MFGWLKYLWTLRRALKRLDAMLTAAQVRGRIGGWTIVRQRTLLRVTLHSPDKRTAYQFGRWLVCRRLRQPRRRKAKLEVASSCLTRDEATLVTAMQLGLVSNPATIEIPMPLGKIPACVDEIAMDIAEWLSIGNPWKEIDPCSDG